MAKPVRYFVDKVVDVLMYIFISSAIAAIPYYALPNISANLLFPTIAIAAFVGMLSVYLLTPYFDRALARRRKAAEKQETESLKNLTTSLQVYGQEQLHELRGFLSKATQEVDFVGVGSEVVANNIDVIMERIEHGATIRVILPAAQDKELMDRIEWTYGLSNLKGVIDRTFQLLLDKRMELPSVDFGKLDVLTNKILFPVYGMILLDPNSDDAIIRVEIYLAGVDPSSRPILFVGKKEQPSLFENYYKSYRYMLKRCE